MIQLSDHFNYKTLIRFTLPSIIIEQDDDISLYEKKYVTISPVKNDWNNYEFLEKLMDESIV